MKIDHFFSPTWSYKYLERRGWTKERINIREEIASRELAKAEAEIAKWEHRVLRQRNHMLTYPFFGGIDLELSKQFLATFEAALADAYKRRDRLLWKWPLCAPMHRRGRRRVRAGALNPSRVFETAAGTVS